MTEEKTEIEKNQSQMVRMIAIVASVAYVLFGLYIYALNIGYYESGQGWFLLLYILAGGGFIFGMFREITPLIFGTLLVAIICVSFSIKSFNWRKEYINHGFILSEYLPSYPTYFQTFRARLFGGERIVDFANSCLGTERRPTEERRLPRECLSINAINNEFGVNIFNILNSQYLRMKRTAQAISEDRAMQIGYPACINNRSCARVELLPPDMPEEQIKESRDPQIVRIRDGFWELLDLHHITPNICQGMVLCRRLAELNVLSNTQMQELKEFQENRNNPAARTR